MARAAKMSFTDWMAAVDARLVAKCGLDHHDLADVCYADYYEDGVSPASAATKAIRANGGDF